MVEGAVSVVVWRYVTVAITILLVEGGKEEGMCDSFRKGIGTIGES
jgi:hypothetical protein